MIWLFSDELNSNSKSIAIEKNLFSYRKVSEFPSICQNWTSEPIGETVDHLQAVRHNWLSPLSDQLPTIYRIQRHILSTILLEVIQWQRSATIWLKKRGRVDSFCKYFSINNCLNNRIFEWEQLLDSAFTSHTTWYVFAQNNCLHSTGI